MQYLLIMSDFKNENKRIIKNSIFLYLRMIIVMMVSLYTSRVILLALGVEDFGIYNVVGGIVTLFDFVNSAMSQTSQRYIAFELGNKVNGDVSKVFKNALTIHAIIAVFVFIFAETIGVYILNNYLTIPVDRLYAANWVYQFSVVSCIIMIFSTPFYGAIIAFEHMRAFAYISLIDTILRLVIALIISFSKVDNLILYAGLLFVLQGTIRLVYGIYCKFNLPGITFRLSFEKNTFKSMFSFTGWTLFDNLSLIACSQGLNLLLNSFFSPIVNAARGIAMQVELAVSSFSKNFQVALNPQIIKSYSNTNKDRFLSLIYSSSKYSFYLLMVLATPILLETEFILNLWLVEVPEYTAAFIKIILLVSLFNVLMNPLTVGVSATGFIKYFQIVSGLLLITVLPISYLIFKYYGCPPISAFVVYLVISILVYLFKIYYASVSLKFRLAQYLTTILLRVCVTFSINYWLCDLISQNLAVSSFFKLLLNCLLYLLISLTVVVLIGLNQNERMFFLNLLKNRLLKK